MCEERGGVRSERVRQVAEHGDTYDARADLALERDLVSQGWEIARHVSDGLVDEPRESVFGDHFSGDFGREAGTGLVEVLPRDVSARDLDSEGLGDARRLGVHGLLDERFDDAHEHMLLSERLPDCSSHESGRDVLEYAVGGPCHVGLERRQDLGVGHSHVRCGLKFNMKRLGMLAFVSGFRASRIKFRRSHVHMSAEWGRLGLMDEVVEGLEGMGLETPAKIQNLAIPRILNGEDVLFAAETGSGKTLAYLAPIFSMLKAEEAFAPADRVDRRPRALVLVPTRELAVQVGAVAKELAKSGPKLTCRSLAGGSEGVGKQRQMLAGCALDVVVATPGRFQKLWKQGDVFVSRVSHVVVDEADTILSQGFGAELREILKATLLFRSEERRRAQLVLTTATLTRAVRDAFCGGGGNRERRELWSFVPPVSVLESDSLHKTVSGLVARPVDVVGKDKMLVLPHHITATKTIVFCNTVQSCRAVDFGLREAERNFNIFCYHGDMNSAEREASLATFRNATSAVLVCTDLAARGLDLPAVDHVVNFDFPRNPVDFLHRAGRTARFGKHGKITSLVAKHDRVLSTAVHRSIQHNLPLDALTSDKRHYEPGGKLHTKVVVATATKKAKARREIAAARSKSRASAPPRRSGGGPKAASASSSQPRRGGGGGHSKHTTRYKVTAADRRRGIGGRRASRGGAPAAGRRAPARRSHRG